MLNMSISNYGAIIQYDYNLSYKEQIERLKEQIYANNNIVNDLEKELNKQLLVHTIISNDNPSIQCLDARSFSRALPLAIKLNVHEKIYNVLKDDLKNLEDISEESYNVDCKNKKELSGHYKKIFSYNWDNHDGYEIWFN